MTDSYFITFEDSDENIAMRYADDVLRYQTQLPLALSWSTYSGVADPGFLFSDDEEQSILYPAGTNRTAIQIQTKDRYSGITITVLSGAPSVYVQVSEYFADLNPAFIAAPYTVSGDSGLNDLYLATYTEDTPEFPEDYWIPLPGEGSYKIVFPSPVVGNAITVTHSGSSPYKISQILPRKSVQAYDLEVNSIKAYHVSSTLIDTIALQVADSIVVGPDLIGAKSIDGSKIIDGTISGVLIRDGTVTGNKVLAGTISGVLITAGSITSNQIAVSGITAINLAANSITADNINVRTITADKIVLNGITSDEMAAAAVTSTVLANNAVVSGKVAANAIYGESIVGGVITGYHVAANTITAANIAAGTITANELSVNQLDAVAANMGTLTVNSGISIGTSGSIWAGAGSANTPTTGLKIYTTNGVSRLTTFSGGIAQVDIGSDGKLYVGSGQTLRLDSTGITLKPSVTGILNTGISSPPAISTYEIRPPISNLIKYKPFYYQTDASNVTTFYDYTTDIHSFAIGANQTYLKDSSGGVVDNDTYDGIDAKIRVGWLSSESDAAGYHKINNSSLSITSKGDTNSSLLVGTPANKVQMDKNGVTISGYSSFGAGVNIQANTTITGDILTIGDIAVDGNIHAGLGDHVFTVNGTTGNLHVGAPPHVFTVNGSSGNTTISGNLSVGPEPHAFKVNSSTGNTALIGTLSLTNITAKPTLTITGSGTSGTSGSIILENSSVITAGQKQGYINMDGNKTLEITNEVTGGFVHLNIPNDGTLKVFANSPVNPQLLVDGVGAIITGTLDVTGQTTLAALNASGAVGFGTSNNKFTVAAATGNTAIAGTLGVTGALTLNNNFLQYNYGGLFKNVAQNIAAGADAKIIFQVSYTNGTIDSVANSRLTITHTGYYILTAGVVSATVGSAFQVVTGGAFGSGTLLAGIIQADMRAYVTKPVYLTAGTNVELWVRNSGGSIIAVTTGGNGTILIASKGG